MQDNKNEVVALLRGYAQKFAAEGSPDRLTTADGQGGITASAGSIKKDPGEGDLKQDLPTDAQGRSSQTPNSSPDRLTVADGQGGINASGGSIKKDPGEGDLKQDLPTDGTTRKSASERVLAIRQAISTVNPGLMPAPAPTLQKSSGAPAPVTSGALNLSQDTLAKIASQILATEEGINFTHDLFEKQAGEQSAQAQIRDAILAAQSYDQGEQIKSAALDDVFSKAAAVYEDLAQMITEIEADEILKTASMHQAELLKLDHPLLKAGYAAGMDDAALMEAADEAGGAEGAPPPEEAIPMGGDQLGEEEIMQLLQEMIASGEITEEDVAAALQQAEGGGEGLPPEGGGEEMLPPEGGGEELPPPDPAMTQG